MKIRRNICILICIFLFSNLFSEKYSRHQLIPAGHWLYDAYYVLANQQKKVSLLDNAPISLAEFDLFFSKIDFDLLDNDSKSIYKKIQDYLTEEKYNLDFAPVKIFFNLNLNPILMYKSNDEIDWNFATDYSGPNNNVDAGYGTSSGYSSDIFTKPFLSVPIRITFPEHLIIELEPFLGKSFWAMSDNDNYSNIPFSGTDLDFLWPRNAYLSTGLVFDNWGINLHIAKEGLQIGRTQTGSIIYNSTFETDAYIQLSLYSNKFKYNLDTVQINNNRNLYLHHLTCNLFENLKFSVIEGTFVNAPLEIRFLNPLMIMHSYAAWDQYLSSTEKKYYGEAHVCQYFAFNFDFIPIKNLRLYILFAMNEFQIPYELGSDSANALPNSLGGQLGLEYTLPFKEGWFFGALEGVYTSPYFYLKQGADWSLYSKRYNMQSYGSVPIYSWIGSPFGPDSIAAQFKFGYKKLGKWSAEVDYLFVAHGINSFGLFDKKIIVKDEYGNDIEIDAYYPSVLLKSGKITAEEAKEMARSMYLKGNVQYTNELSFKGSYTINNHFSFDASFTYTFIFNNHNISGDFAQGIQMCFGAKYMLF